MNILNAPPTEKKKILLHEVSSDYINNMVYNIKEMKAFILDDETEIMIGLEYSKSQALKDGIFLFQNISKINKNQKNDNLSGIFFIRPTDQNLEHLKEILLYSLYKEFHIFFTNQINEDLIKKIAQYDIHCKVKSLQEVYLDYYIINSNLFHLNIDSCIPNLSIKSFNKWTKYDNMLFNRIIQGLISICLSNRLYPIIKCVKGSKICRKIGDELSNYFTTNYDSFIKKECSKEQNGILLLFDRKEDPITPLINQWTYQAMLHEIIGIKNNIISIKKDKDSSKEESYVISDIEDNDMFFSTQMNNDYGSVANEIEKEAEKLKKENKEMSNSQATMEELRKLIDNLPKKKKESQNITNHYKLFYTLCDYITRHKLMDLSQIEQDIACSNNKRDQLNKILPILKDENVSSLDKAKLYILYSFRYEGDSTIQLLKKSMEENNLNDWIIYGDLLIKYAGKDQRNLDVLSNKNIISLGKKFFMNAFGSKNNVFMQHVSLLNDLVDRLIKGRIRDNEIETIFKTNSNIEGRPNKIILFSFGGITYEECKDLTFLGNQCNIPIICGGTNILNSKSFLAELNLMKNIKEDDVEALDINL